MADITNPNYPYSTVASENSTGDRGINDNNRGNVIDDRMRLNWSATASAIETLHENDVAINTELTNNTSRITGAYGAGWVNNSRIRDNTIEDEKIRLRTLTNRVLADNSVDSRVLADDAVETDNIEDNAVTEDKLADDAVTADKIASGALGAFDTSVLLTQAAYDALSTRNSRTLYLIRA